MMRGLVLSILGLTLVAPLALAHDGRRPKQARPERRVELRERMLRHRARVRFEVRQRMRAELFELRRELVKRRLERARNVR
jgi:hypothetical protein